MFDPMVAIHLLAGIALGIALDRFVLTPLVYWHARSVRHERR